MKISRVTFYYNTPFTTFNNTIHFGSNSERDIFFDSMYQQVSFNLNVTLDRLELRVPIPHGTDTKGINYCRINYAFDNNKSYYFFILADNSYTNDGVTKFALVPDALMTFTQGNVLQQAGVVKIHRQHVTNGTYNSRLEELRTNNDVLACKTKRYVKTFFFPFKELAVVFQTSVNIEQSFGTETKPQLKLPQGITYDSIPSPVGLYYCELNDWRDFSGKLLDFPWIGQNINNIVLIPRDFIDTNDLVKASLNGKDTTLIKKFRNGGTSANKLVNTITKEQVLQALKLTPEEMHLCRSEYATCEMTAWDGQLVPLPLEHMPDKGIQLQMMNAVGYSNTVAIYPDSWCERADDGSGQVKDGSFLNTALIFKNWTSIPMLIDNYKLSLAQSANQRSYAESRTLTGRMNNISQELGDFASGQGSFQRGQDLFVDAYSIAGGGLHLATIGSKIVDDTEFYRQQKAQFADLALSSPSLTAQSEGQAFQVANGIYGVTVKLSAPSAGEQNHLRQYYGSMGFSFEEYGAIEPLDSMSICNYLQCEGNITLDNVPTGYVQMIQGLLATGVRFWKNTGMRNPMNQPTVNNKRVK